MKAPSGRDRIRAQLADLKMPGALEALDQVLSGIDGGSLSAPEAIESLLGAGANRSRDELDNCYGTDYDSS